MTQWRKGLHKYKCDLMDFVAEVVLLKSEELTSGGRTSSGKMISSGKENSVGIILDTALARRFFLRVSSENSDGEVLILVRVRF